MTEEHQMTRREYREQQTHRLDHSPEAATEKSQQNLDDKPFIERSRSDTADDSEEPRQTREESLAEQKQALTEEKTNRLRQKLNRVIIGLVIAIILVYLGLFFVG